MRYRYLQTTGQPSFLADDYLSAQPAQRKCDWRKILKKKQSKGSFFRKPHGRVARAYLLRRQSGVAWIQYGSVKSLKGLSTHRVQKLVLAKIPKLFQMKIAAELVELYEGQVQRRIAAAWDEGCRYQTTPGLQPEHHDRCVSAHSEHRLWWRGGL